MAFFRNPKGVFVRQSPDMYQGNCFWGWVAGVGTGSDFHDAGIQNLDQSGRTMLVWGVIAAMFFNNLATHPTGTISHGFINGHEDATGFGTLTPLSPLNPAVSANVWDTPTGNGIDTAYQINQILTGAGQVEIFPTYPIAAIPTTWSIAVGMEWVAGASSVNWSIGWLVEFVGPQP